MSKPLYQGSGASGALALWHPTDWHAADPGATSRCLQQIQIWVSRYRQRRALADLAAMNNHLLRDIGVSLQDAEREAAKPFWRA
ncbi:MAG TPA: DUF1127 domain-containing protein [Alphaproteobacteria bacterium]|nr:DUF1127 domain-containing protein [Alphaproteobacteria bacterium]